MKKIAVVVIVVLLLPVAAHSATVEGYVSCTGNPQPAYMIVGAFSAVDMTNYGYVSADGSGFYSIAVPDNGAVLLLFVSSTGGVYEGYGVHEYVPVTKALTVGTGTVQADLVTQPAFQLILEGHSGSDILDENAYPGMFLVNEDDRAQPILALGSENAGLSVVVPSYNLPLGNRYAIYLPWELPHAGRVMVRLDDAGAGYMSNEQGARVLDVSAEAAASAIATLENDIAASDVPTVEASASLENARDKFDQGDHDEAAGLAIVAAEDLALASAQAGIDKYRKGDLTIRVLDADGTEVPGADVSVAMQSRDFRFGAFDNYSEVGGADYRKAYEDGLNYVTAGFYWNMSEPQDDAYAWDYLDHDAGVRDFAEIGYRIKGHPLVWLMDIAMPDYLKAMTYDELGPEIREHAAAMVGHYSDAVHTWDIINEAHGRPASGNLSRDQVTSLTREVAETVVAVDPGATKVVNCAFDWFGQSIASEIYEPDHEPGFSLPIPEYIQGLLDDGIPFDAIGQQAYDGGCSTFFRDLGLGEAISVPTFDLATLSRMLRRLGEFGMPIHLTEQSVPSIMMEDCPDEGYWRNPWSEMQQAEFVEAWFTLGFGADNVQAVTWWDFSDKNAFIKAGGLIDENGTEKPSYVRLRELFTRWSTNESDSTEDDGAAFFRPFAGDYLISVAVDGHGATTTVHIAEQTSRTVEIVLENYRVPAADDFGETDDETDGDESSPCGCGA